MTAAVRRTLVLALLLMGWVLCRRRLGGHRQPEAVRGLRGGNASTDQLMYTAASGETNRLIVRVEGPVATVVSDSAGITPERVRPRGQ